MIKSVTVTNHRGESLKLDLMNPYLSGFAIRSITGLGPGSATINMSDYATGDGSFYSSSKMSSRNIVLSLKYLWKNSIEDTRQLSYRYFPIKKKVTLRIETDNREVEIDGYVETNDPTIFSNDEGSDISIICPNPHFRSVKNGGIQTSSFSAITPLFEFSFSNESTTEELIEMGTIDNRSEKTIVYEGDVETGVTITIKFPYGLSAKHITIVKPDTNEKMVIDLTKYPISGAILPEREIVINTTKGQKTILLMSDGGPLNILNCLAKDCDWFVLEQGENKFAYTTDATETDYLIQFIIENQILYSGV